MFCSKNLLSKDKISKMHHKIRHYIIYRHSVTLTEWILLMKEVFRRPKPIYAQRGTTRGRASLREFCR